MESFVGTRAALELLEPLEPYASNDLNGAQRLNAWNYWNGPVPVRNGVKRWNVLNGLNGQPRERGTKYGGDRVVIVNESNF
jgi:hypothetical protein